MASIMVEIENIKKAWLKVKKVFNQTFYSQFEGSLDDISLRTASGSCYKDRYYTIASPSVVKQ